VTVQAGNERRRIRRWSEVTRALSNLKSQGFIADYGPRGPGGVTVLVAEGVECGPYSIKEAYAWIEACEAMGAAAWTLDG
jgi:hypothetical protein